MINAIILMLILGAILGIGLAVADRFLAVESDERVESVLSMLPNYNCGSCGYPGCSGLAQALVDGEIDEVGTCKPCKPEQKEEIANYLNTTPAPDGTCLKVKA